MNRPACGDSGIASDMILPPVILTSCALQQFVPLDDKAALIRAHVWSRLADPPDTPPPVAGI